MSADPTYTLAQESAAVANRGRARRAVVVCQEGEAQHGDDWLVEEAPVELRYNGDAFAVMMATPADLEDFACGFALSENHVSGIDAIRGVTVAELLDGYVIDIHA
ncbi:MAG TPA: formate dehydrogenase accessory sulfurtransferase FdhD, partial [Rudaea sp.]|nr:formate dehydrogenase accessory sulfurtransferase FdhD [Rudaea sp.]